MISFDPFLCEDIFKLDYANLDKFTENFTTDFYLNKFLKDPRKSFCVRYYYSPHSSNSKGGSDSNSKGVGSCSNQYDNNKYDNQYDNNTTYANNLTNGPSPIYGYIIGSKTAKKLECIERSENDVSENYSSDVSENYSSESKSSTKSSTNKNNTNKSNTNKSYSSKSKSTSKNSTNKSYISNKSYSSNKNNTNKSTSNLSHTNNTYTNNPSPNTSILIKLGQQMNALTVSPMCRRQGIGSVLVNILTEEAEEKDFVKLFVRAGNQNAVDFYRSKGFTLYRVIKGYYYSPKEDAFEMIKTNGFETIQVPDVNGLMMSESD